ncbi:MAG: hypothetical protein ACRCT6_00500, partial [Notoacmeibacter sp.]
MSDRNFTPPSRPRDIERYAELSDLLGDTGNNSPQATREFAVNAPDATSLESALASVDATFVIRPREVSISSSSARNWQSAPGSFSRATPVAAPLAPVTLDAWDLRPAINPNSEVGNEPVFESVQAEMAPEITMPEEAFSDEDAFQSVLEGLEDDLLSSEEMSSFAEPEVQVEAQSQYVDEPAFEAVNDQAQQLQVHVADSFDPKVDFDSAFNETFEDELPTAAPQNALAADQTMPFEFQKPLYETAATPVPAPVYEEPAYEDFESELAAFDEPEPETETAFAERPESLVAIGAGLATVAGAVRANASRESVSTSSDLPVAAHAESVTFSADAISFFPEVTAPYEEVPSTGSLDVPEFAVAEAATPQFQSDFEDFGLEQLEAPRSSAAQRSDQPDSRDVMVHEQVYARENQGNFDELADMEFADAFEKDFNPTDELANVVAPDLNDDPFLKPSS